MSKPIEPVAPLKSDPSLQDGLGGPKGDGGGGAGGAESASDKGDPDKGDGEKAAPEAKQPRSLYYVVGPGSVFFQGKAYEARAQLRLTDAEAEDLGESVKPGKAPPSKAQVGARKAGVYAVAGPGSVFHNGKLHEAGALLDLSEADAKSLGAAIKDVE